MAALLFLAQTLRIAIPYLLAAAGGVLSERAGLIGLTLEGYMLGGAFCAAVTSYAAGAAGYGAAARRACGNSRRGGALDAVRDECDSVQGRSDRHWNRDQFAGDRAHAVLS